MKKCFLLLFLSLIAFLHFSCKKPDITPAYLLLSIEDFEDCIDVSNFNRIHDTNYDNEELDIIKQQKFGYVLVTLNGKQVGYYALPCKVPLLPDYSAQNNIEVTPCVRILNTTFTAVRYDFLKPVRHFFKMEKEGEYKLSDIKFEYRDEILFPLLETFTQSTLFAPVDSVYPTPMTIFHEGGESMGKIALEDDALYFNVATPYFTLDLMNAAGRVVKHFWEIYYECEHGDMMTYVTFRSPEFGTYHQDLVGFLSTNKERKKAYIDLTDYVIAVGSYSTQVSMRLGIRGLRAAGSENQNAYFYFENMKLISGAPY